MTMKALYLSGFYLLTKETKRDKMAEAKLDVRILLRYCTIIAMSISCSSEGVNLSNLEEWGVD